MAQGEVFGPAGVRKCVGTDDLVCRLRITRHLGGVRKTGQPAPEQVREYCNLSLISTTMDAQVLPRKTNVFTNPPNYAFAFHRLRKTLRDPSKQPIVLVACGSFSPVTYLHLRMFEMAKDYVRQNTNFEIVGGYLSPVSDQYNKPGLLSAHHR